VQVPYAPQQLDFATTTYSAEIIADVDNCRLFDH
jgi:hypothetical protein